MTEWVCKVGELLVVSRARYDYHCQLACSRSNNQLCPLSLAASTFITPDLSLSSSALLCCLLPSSGEHSAIPPDFPDMSLCWNKIKSIFLFNGNVKLISTFPVPLNNVQKSYNLWGIYSSWAAIALTGGLSCSSIFRNYTSLGALRVHF